MTTTLNVKFFSNCFVLLSLLLVALCIFQIGFYTKERCQITRYKNKIFTLAEHNKSLTINFSKLSSLTNIDYYISNQNFVEPENIEYIEVLGSSIATRN